MNVYLLLQDVYVGVACPKQLNSLTIVAIGRNSES